MLRLQVGFEYPSAPGERCARRVYDWPEALRTIDAKRAAGFLNVRLERLDGSEYWRGAPLHETMSHAWRYHRHEALAAWEMFRGYCNGSPPPRVPGMDTVLRLAVRLYHGLTVEEAAAREYAYRWQLALGTEINRLESRSRSRGNVWGWPHLLGM